MLMARVEPTNSDRALQVNSSSSIWTRKGRRQAMALMVGSFRM